MASSSVSSLILFIAAMTVAAGVAGTLVTSVSNVADSIDTESVDAAQKIDTEIEAISDPGSDAMYDGGTGEITLLLKNTGARPLVASNGNVDVLVDGQYVTTDAFNVSVVGAEAWGQGSVARLTIDRSLSAGPHRVVVFVNDDREVLRFEL